MSRKQQLLKRHRRNKRLGLLAGLIALVAIGAFSWWWLPLLLLPLLWAAHEAWFADHLFYAPGEDYAYDFGEQTREAPASLSGGLLPKATAIETAIRGGVRRVHVISYDIPDAVLAEVFTNEGTGTLIVADINALSAAEQQSGGR